MAKLPIKTSALNSPGYLLPLLFNFLLAKTVIKVEAIMAIRNGSTVISK
ncbi:hypothetical protein GCM10023149_45670 [Mucilaginibacter gynuensis]|uniref:Uncharacterized protein n=1 Tax=Mucilaginibacter gynuensis TaxID=1302236 RepID=A0ABP8HAE7_9SPHI